MRATPRRSAARWPPRRSFRPARTLRTGGHRRRLRAQSPRRAAGLPEITTAITHLRDVSRRGDLRIARPQGRDDDHHRHGDLRIRPNRPGPSRTRTPLLSCASRVSNARAAQHLLNRLQQSVRPRRGTPSPGSRRGRVAIVLADSPLACIRMAKAAFSCQAPWAVQCAARVPDALPVPLHGATAQLKLKLCQAGEYPGHHPTCGVGGVDAFPQRAQHDVPLTQLANRRHHLSGVAAQPINANDDNCVPGRA